MTIVDIVVSAGFVVATIGVLVLTFTGRPKIDDFKK